MDAHSLLEEVVEEVADREAARLAWKDVYQKIRHSLEKEKKNGNNAGRQSENKGKRGTERS